MNLAARVPEEPAAAPLGAVPLALAENENAQVFSKWAKIIFSSGEGFPFSNAIRAGDFVYVSGQVAFLPDGTISIGSIEAQTKIVLDTLQNILAQAGCTMADVVRCGCTLQDARDFDAFNKTYATYFSENPPVRTTAVVQHVLDARVEIDCIAYKPLKNGE